MTNESSANQKREKVIDAIERGGLNATQLQQILDVADALGLPQESIEKAQAQFTAVLPHSQPTRRVFSGNAPR